MKGFVLQGGDPTGTGKGGESIWGGTFPDEFHHSLRYLQACLFHMLVIIACVIALMLHMYVCRHDKRGIVSMATNGPDLNASQFFILYAPQTHLNDKNTVFGEVIEGFDVLDTIEKVPVGKKNRPINEIRILSSTIHANPLAPVHQ